MFCERQAAERLAHLERAAQVGGADPHAALEPEHLAQPLRRAQHLAAVLVVDRVHEPLDEREPSRRGLRVGEIVDRVDRLHRRDTTNRPTVVALSLSLSAIAVRSFHAIVELLSTSGRKSQGVMPQQTMSVFAVIVAVRSEPVRSAISPK